MLFMHHWQIQHIPKEERQFIEFICLDAHPGESFYMHLALLLCEPVFIRPRRKTLGFEPEGYQVRCPQAENISLDTCSIVCYILSSSFAHKQSKSVSAVPQSIVPAGKSIRVPRFVCHSIRKSRA